MLGCVLLRPRFLKYQKDPKGGWIDVKLQKTPRTFPQKPWQLNALLEPYLHIHPSHLYGIFTCIDAGKWRWIRCVWLFSNEKSSRGKVENRQRLAVGTSQTVFEATHVWSWCQQCVPAIHAMELGTERHDAWIPAATDLTPFQSSRNCLRIPCRGCLVRNLQLELSRSEGIL